MASTGVLSHSSLTAGITENWAKLGENVGVGPDNPTVWNAFLHSAEHYANLVDPAFNRVGVGVAIDGNGTEWTCHKFMELVGASAPPPPARAPAPVRSVAPVVHTAAPVYHAHQRWLGPVRPFGPARRAGHHHDHGAAGSSARSPTAGQLRSGWPRCWRLSASCPPDSRASRPRTRRHTGAWAPPSKPTS